MKFAEALELLDRAGASQPVNTYGRTFVSSLNCRFITFELSGPGRPTDAVRKVQLEGARSSSGVRPEWAVAKNLTEAVCECLLRSKFFFLDLFDIKGMTIRVEVRRVGKELEKLAVFSFQDSKVRGKGELVALAESVLDGTTPPEEALDYLSERSEEVLKSVDRVRMFAQRVAKIDAKRRES